jgi:hypothetical protein
MRTPDGQEMPASNRHGSVHACQVMQIEGGKIQATHAYFDLMTILQQIGAMERAGAAV